MITPPTLSLELLARAGRGATEPAPRRQRRSGPTLVPVESEEQELPSPASLLSPVPAPPARGMSTGSPIALVSRSHPAPEPLDPRQARRLRVTRLLSLGVILISLSTVAFTLW